ncbi:MAG: DUF2934 domain-containing protein [Pseudomonadota bacterium]|nr:DUF2934 domain-containing protein [Nevskiales bacterium]MEC9363532.1 DUF2934 domain-containing protein [Pseudomonadota bacterium]
MSSKIKRTQRPPAAPAAADDPASAAPPCARDNRHTMIAEAAYYRAEQRGFCGGADEATADWLDAEAEVDRTLSLPGSPERTATSKTR